MKKKTGNIRSISVGRKDLYLLSPDSIEIDDGWNVRRDTDDLQDHIRQLANSIKEIGVQQPLTVYMRGSVAVVTDGHCRLYAVRLAVREGVDIKSIPVRIEERFSNEADRVLSILTRNNGKSLTVAEQAEVVKRLLLFGWSEAEVARKTGTSRQHVNNLVRFLSSPEEVKQMVMAGEVSATVAVQQVKKEGVGATKTLKDAVSKAKGEGKKRATRKHIKPERDVVLEACKECYEIANRESEYYSSNIASLMEVAITEIIGSKELKAFKKGIWV